MSRNAYRGPKLPRSLLDQVQDGHVSKKGAGNVSRKDGRKQERQQKKAVRSNPRSSFQDGRRQQDRRHEDIDDSDKEVEEDVAAPTQSQAIQKSDKPTKPLKSILKRPAQAAESASDSEGSEEVAAPVISSAVKSKLRDDDDEIAALEKKLGIKSKKSKALEVDGLNWIAEGSDGDSEDDDSNGLKRKRVEDTEWLRDKRLKAGAPNEDISGSNVRPQIAKTSASSSNGDDDDLSEIDDEVDNLSLEDGSGEEFEEFDSEEGESLEEDEVPEKAPKRQRENPYTAPVLNVTASTAKYVPPSLRKPAASEGEALQQLRRQLQGLLNRLSEANMLSILQSLDDLYTKNARGHVTSTLVDLLVALISDPSTLNDAFLILHAGFAAGVYKVVGTDFGAHLLEKLVEAFDHHRNRTTGTSKQTQNLLAYLACLYTFQVVASGLIFDYIRLLLEEITETNTELLLRVIRTSGQQLRQDDPSSLKDIVLLLQRSVASTDEQNLSVRTKFMIETINDLKNNRMKGGAAASAVAAEHTTRMKKTLGSLNTSRSLKATEPLRISLSDIRDTEKKGKWWLVGASYLDPAKHTVNGSTPSILPKSHHDEDAGYESETPGSVNLNKLARTQGMITDVRRAIFVTILSSAYHEEAHMRLLKLHLKSKQMLEVPRVLLHCVGAEQTYNPFYCLLARRFCDEHKLRKAFEFALWDVFKQMDVDGEDEDGAEKMTMRKMVNIAKFSGTLIANGGLDIRLLKQLDFQYLQEQTGMFFEIMLTTVFVHLRKKKDFEKAVKNVFSRTAGVPGLSQGLMLFLQNVMSESQLSTGKEKRAVEKGLVVAVEALREAANANPGVDGGEESE